MIKYRDGGKTPHARKKGPGRRHQDGLSTGPKKGPAKWKGRK